MKCHSFTRKFSAARATLGAILALSVALSIAPRAQAASGDITYIANPPEKPALLNGAAGPAAFPYTPSQCAQLFGLACYTPAEIRTAYNIPSTYTGAGQTIVIVDAYGSPTIQSDLQVFDRTFGLPDPTLNVIYPGGNPQFNLRQHHEEANWAVETSLDVEWAHAIAPGATIDLVVAANNGGNVLNLAQRYAVDHHLGNVMSLSFGAPEAAINGRGNNTQLQQADAVYQAARAAGITVFASAGDQGATNTGDCRDCTTPNASFPASDPNVTAVGGTDLFAGDSGAYGSETTWNDSDPATCPFGCTQGDFGATGGAPSAIFPAPSYQQALSHNAMRTTADVGYNAGVYTAVLVYLSFLGPAQAGFYFVGGTSAGTPQWAAITSLADQAAGHALGFLNPTLYGIGANPTTNAADFHDVTVGNNQFPYPSAPGFSAQTGYDLPTGLGTPNAANLIATLCGC